MNKYIKITLFATLLIAFLSTVSYCCAPYDTEPAETISVRKTVGGDGYILRNETIIEPEQSGVFEASVEDGSRVSGRSAIGVLISGNYSEELVSELETVTTRIAEVKKSGDIADVYSSDQARVFTALHDLSKDIRTSAKDGDFQLAAQNTLQLKNLLEKKFSAENSGAAQELLSDLEEKKESLEARLGNIRENIFTPVSGYFYTTFDGLEQKRPEKELFALTTADVYSIPQTLKEYKKPRSQVAKIVDTYAWYLVATLPKEEAELLTIDSSVTLSIDESAPVKALVKAINYDEFGMAAIVVKCTRDTAGIFEKREVSFEICYEEYSGLYVPAAAIRIKDEQTGVYVLGKNDTVSFRLIDITFQDEDFVIARTNFAAPAGSPYGVLKIHDNILVNPEAVKNSESEK